MIWQVRTEMRPSAGLSEGTVYILEGGTNRIEIWPWLGFNCLRWEMEHQGQTIDLLWSDPQLWSDPRPTRSGIPILFPFPNRIRDGRFTWAGQEYQLPINGPQGRHAIHGFACFRPWRVLDAGGNENQAWIKAAFQGARDAPECRSLWPADYAIEVTYALSAGQLRLEAVVTNPDKVPLPFGLGLHPYQRFPADPSLFFVKAPGDVEQWPLTDCLPSGPLKPLDEQQRPLAHPAEWKLPSALAWDDAFRVSSVTPTHPLRTWLVDRQRDLAVCMEARGGFRDLVVFTPPHRQAVCLEPYTCVTDAMNLQARGLDTGLIVLQPGESWRGVVNWQKGAARSPEARG